ncbi:MAG TPA: bifunctional YncE family protein/alkaline phosphatase family protein [Verrucomicrobiae bacterium]|jgi:YVTN family beta-propeller protein|nr:bifunctional YncE family protein/alkaline phosphatase family protein [Verrucomicrobiae bacterium]
MKCLIFTVGLLAALGLHTAHASDSDGTFGATTESVGWKTNGFETPVNQLLTPAGTLIELQGMRPNALALSPDGHLLVTSGLKGELVVLEAADGKILQHVPMPLSKNRPGVESVSSLIWEPNLKDKLAYTGLVFSPDGTRIYLSNVNGDVKVFAVGKDRKVSPLFSIPLPPANMPGRKEDIPAGIAVSPDGVKIYVALNVANKLAEIDSATGKVLRIWDVGVAPFGVALAGGKIYVSNWGGRRPDANSVVGPIGRNGVVRVDTRSIASEGSVSIIDPTSGSTAPAKEFITGLHACALAASPNGKFVVCANAGSDTLSVIDTHADAIVETVSARQRPGDPFGAQPDAVAFNRRGTRLFVCNASQNAVAVFQFKPGESKMLGLIPVGWFPGSVAYDARRNAIDVANIISVTQKKAAARNGGEGFNTKQYYGSLSLVPLPSSRGLEKFTQTALSNLRYPLLAQARLPARENRPAQPVPERVGEPSVFNHVIYIIKENRTYDQVLGDVKEGDGEADLCVFGAHVTPNQHKFVRDFVLLDNTYCSGIMSAEGHQWTDSSLANDYAQRSYAGWPRSYSGGGSDANGDDAMMYSSAGFIWDDALSHGKTFCDFGEYTTPHIHWRATGQVENKWVDSYRDFVTQSNAIVYTATADLDSIRPYIMTNYMPFDLHVPDVFRASQFRKDFKRFEDAGTLANLIVLWLPDDHTSGTGFGAPAPDAQVADNDLAFGQIVETVSHSKFWTNTCILAVEDDPQDGWDHVSGYRTTAYVISPYTKRHTVVSTQYNQTSLVRTIELILGLPPMNQLDATATPMFDCFTNTPDFTAYDTVTNQVPLDKMNPHPKRISDAILRKDAYVSAKLPLEKEDQCPEDLFNRILWRAMKGSRTPYPDWAVKRGDDDDD